MSAAATPSAPALSARTAANPWLIASAVMAATFMEVLDTTVVNVSLPHIAGSMSVTPEEATWVLTSYLVANAIILPATGWLSSYFGRKRFLMVCIVIFTIASAFCGAATSLTMLIVERVFQGMGGGALQPLVGGRMISRPRGNYSWVVGDEEHVSLHILRSEEYASS